MFPICSTKSFYNLVTVDETWVYYFEPKRKCSVPNEELSGAFYKNVALKKLKAHSKRLCPKTGLKYFLLPHNNASPPPPIRHAL